MSSYSRLPDSKILYISFNQRVCTHEFMFNTMSPKTTFQQPMRVHTLRSFPVSVVAQRPAVVFCALMVDQRLFEVVSCVLAVQFWLFLNALCLFIDSVCLRVVLLSLNGRLASLFGSFRPLLDYFASRHGQFASLFGPFLCPCRRFGLGLPRLYTQGSGQRVFFQVISFISICMDKGEVIDLKWFKRDSLCRLRPQRRQKSAAFCPSAETPSHLAWRSGTKQHNHQHVHPLGP